MVGVDFADGGGEEFVEGFQLGAEVGGVEVGRDRLVEQLVAQDYGLVAVAVGDCSPEVGRHRGVVVAVVDERVAEAVVDVRARLPTGGTVQIQHQIQVVLY